MKTSIIVCTNNRSHAIKPCCDAIKVAIETAGTDTELIIVDNNSTDNTQSVVSRWTEKNSINVKLVKETKKGGSAARNCGVQNSNGDLLIFIDDDCCPDAHYITNALKHFKKDKELIMRGGSVKLGDPQDLPLTIQTHPDIRRWSTSLDFTRPIGGGDILGCNMMIPRELYNTVGQFDIRLGAGAPIPAGDDTDYILRAYMTGFLIEYVPDVIVYHHHGRKYVEEGKMLMLKYAMGSGALLGKYLFKHPNVKNIFTKKRKNINSTVVSSQPCDPLDNIKPSKLNKLLYRIKGAVLYYYAALTIQQK